MDLKLREKWRHLQSVDLSICLFHRLFCSYPFTEVLLYLLFIIILWFLQVGLFRKPGVKSRIQKLKAMAETQGDEISFEGQQAFDVADMVKQYFRELPEALLTNKLSETFIAIFQRNILYYDFVLWL